MSILILEAIQYFQSKISCKRRYLTQELANYPAELYKMNQILQGQTLVKLHAKNNDNYFLIIRR